MSFYVYEHVRRDTAETRASIRAKATGKVHTAETRAKMTASQKARHAGRRPKQD